MSSEEQTEFLKRAELGCTFAGWLTLNLSLNYYNKWVLSETDFRFPFLLTTVNKTVGLFVAISIMMLKKGMPQPQELLSEFKRPMVHFQGVATALNLGMNNWSLLLITLTLNQVLKATVPLPVAALSVLLEGKTYSWQLCAPGVALQPCAWVVALRHVALPARVHCVSPPSCVAAVPPRAHCVSLASCSQTVRWPCSLPGAYSLPWAPWAANPCWGSSCVSSRR
jgi:hypothetical protein